MNIHLHVPELHPLQGISHVLDHFRYHPPPPRTIPAAEDWTDWAPEGEWIARHGGRDDG